MVSSPGEPDAEPQDQSLQSFSAAAMRKRSQAHRAQCVTETIEKIMPSVSRWADKGITSMHFDPKGLADVLVGDFFFDKDGEILRTAVEDELLPRLQEFGYDVNIYASGTKKKTYVLSISWEE
jgi:hypothetical protein